MSTDPERRSSNVTQLRPVKGRVPPNDLDSEGSILSACLLEPGALDRALTEGLASVMFYADANRLIFDAMVDQHGRGEPHDVTSVASWLKDRNKLERCGGTPYLVQLMDAIPAVTHLESFVKRVRDKWRMRQLIATLIEEVALAHEAIEDTQSHLDEFEGRVSQIVRAYEGVTGLAPIATSVGTAYAEIKEAYETQKPPGTPYGFLHLDRKTNGLHDTDVVVIAGRPGMGKTSFLLDVARNVARGDGDENAKSAVAIFSLEMSATQLALRALASEGRLDTQRMRHGFVQEREWPMLSDAIAAVERMPIWVDDTPAIKLAELQSRARKLQMDLESGRAGSARLGLVAIDYLTLMEGQRRARESREELVAQNMRGLKTLAKDLKVPVIVLAQLNRSCETRTTKDKRPQLSDLRESGSIEQDADSVLFLYRDEYYFPDSPDRGIAEVIISKQRHGPTGVVKLRYTGAYTRFDNLAASEYDEFDDVADEAL